MLVGAAGFPLLRFRVVSLGGRLSFRSLWFHDWRIEKSFTDASSVDVVVGVRFRERSGIGSLSVMVRHWVCLALWSIEPLLSRNEDLAAHWENGFGSSCKSRLVAVGMVLV